MVSAATTAQMGVCYTTVTSRLPQLMPAIMSSFADKATTEAGAQTRE